MNTTTQTSNENKTTQALFEQINNLLATPELNAKWQKNDLFGRINEYDWSPKNGINIEYYEDLVETGKEGDLSDEQFIELIELTNPESYPQHTYFVILTAKQEIAKLIARKSILLIK